VANAWRAGRTPLAVRDDLPQRVSESRIFLYEYNSTAVYGKDRSTFIDKANEMLEALRTERDDVETRSILLLGHSMGGLLIKQALINAHNNPKYTPIKDAATGLVFFATLYHGGDWKL
jgi:triacylglycerol esterase/lipase EstA (alpha/beta hydrolase family)